MLEKFVAFFLLVLIAEVTSQPYYGSNPICYNYACPAQTTMCKKYTESNPNGYLTIDISCMSGYGDVYQVYTETQRNPHPDTAFHCAAFVRAKNVNNGCRSCLFTAAGVISENPMNPSKNKTETSQKQKPSHNFDENNFI